jgi:hypothetical protein
MANTQKTECMRVALLDEREIAKIFRKICQEVQDKAQGDMTLPADPTERIVALNMMNNVFDRIDAALEAFLRKETSSSVRLVAKGEDDASEQGVGLAMDTGERR